MNFILNKFKNFFSTSIVENSSWNILLCNTFLIWIGGFCLIIDVRRYVWNRRNGSESEVTARRWFFAATLVTATSSFVYTAYESLLSDYGSRKQVWDPCMVHSLFGEISLEPVNLVQFRSYTWSEIQIYYFKKILKILKMVTCKVS